MICPLLSFWDCFKLEMDIPHETLISYFDVHEGPKLLFSDENPDGIRDKKNASIPLDQIPVLMDIHQNGDFFIHYYKNIVSVNYCFGIKDSNIRGGEHSFMASLIFDDPNKLGKIFNNMPELKRWSQKISDSLKKSAVIKQLINNKNSRQVENRKILMNILKRPVFS
jgi:hypothetical protein